MFCTLSNWLKEFSPSGFVCKLKFFYNISEYGFAYELLLPYVVSNVFWAEISNPRFIRPWWDHVWLIIKYAWMSSPILKCLWHQDYHSTKMAAVASWRLQATISGYLENRTFILFSQVSGIALQWGYSILSLLYCWCWIKDDNVAPEGSALLFTIWWS